VAKENVGYGAMMRKIQSAGRVVVEWVYQVDGM
jgi:hypothetical protein